MTDILQTVIKAHVDTQVAEGKIYNVLALAKVHEKRCYCEESSGENGQLDRVTCLAHEIQGRYGHLEEKR